MRRIEWIKQRLENWALWKERDSSAARGYPTRSALFNTVTRGGYREAIIPVFEIEAGITNQAVESLRTERFHLYETLHCIYPLGLGIKETARTTSRSESTIKAHLVQADHAIARWLNDNRVDGAR